MQVLRGDAVVAEESAEPVQSPEQLKMAGPVGRCFLKVASLNWKERKQSCSGKSRDSTAKGMGGIPEHGPSGQRASPY